MYEIFELLLKKAGITAYKFCKDTGVSSSTISTWKKNNSRIGMELAEIIANYFGVTIDYLMHGGDEKNNSNQSDLTKKDLKDIEKDLELIQSNITNGAALYYGGAPVDLDEDSNAMLSNAIQIALMTIKRENKKKYNPYKNKKKEV